jgi:hypothetical protein
MIFLITNGLMFIIEHSNICITKRKIVQVHKYKFMKIKE